MSEIMWKKFTYPGIRTNMYLISENGDIRNILTNHILSPYTDKDGYLKICLVSDLAKKWKAKCIYSSISSMGICKESK